MQEITIDGHAVTVADATSKEITISGKSYVVPAGVVSFISAMAREIDTQQRRRVATEAQIDERITHRLDNVLRALSEHGMLSQDLNSEYQLPANMETDGGTWTFFDEARSVTREGLKKDALDNITESIGRG